MALTEQQKTEFLAALGVWNGADAALPIAVLADLGDNMANREDIVSTHETLADFKANRGRPQEALAVPGGDGILHVWRGVQFRKGQPRVSLFLLEFDGVSASMIS